VHPGDNARQVMVRAATEPARSLSSVVPDVPAAVSEWLEKALFFDKLARWESAAAMRTAGLQIQHEFFGPSDEGCLKRLFELRALDIAHSPTELSPTSALSSAVHALSRSTLRSHLDGPETSPSILAPRLEGPPAQPPQNRRLPLAWITIATLVLVIGLVWSLSRPTRPLEASLSAASPSTELARSPVGESSTPAAAAPSANAPAPVVAAASASAHSGGVPASSSPSSAIAKRSGPTGPSVRAPAPALSAVGSQPSAFPAPQAPPAASKQNPLQLDIQ